MTTALILAGSRGGVDPLAQANDVPHKALIAIGGQTMLARVAAALRAGGVDRIVVSTNDLAVRATAGAIGLDVVPSADGPSRSVGQAIDALGVPLLVTTADHALLMGEWVRGFVTGLPASADVAVLLARRDAIEAVVPETRRTYLRFADGDWSGCNLFYFATPGSRRAVDLWERVEADRKRPWRIVRRFGVGMFLRYLLGRLTLREAVARLGRIAGIEAAVVDSPWGLAAVDVDTIGDLALVRRLIGSGPVQHGPAACLGERL